MNYPETLDWLFKQLPMYQRVGAAAYKADLNNTKAICKLLGDPQNKFPSIHVAGTNGKGSVSHMLASILQESGLKTGLYTSPHLKDFRERIRINGEMIPEERVMDFVERYRPDFESIRPSFFEWTVGLAFNYFSEENVDIAVIETGLGGRLDSTNVITPLVTVITNIAYDHMQFLGNTLEKIAVEKAGIIKKGIPVVIGEKQPETEAVFRNIANAKGAPIAFADEMDIDLSDFDLPVRGGFHEKNLQTILAVTGLLPTSGLTTTRKDIVAGIRKVAENTGFKGRWQTLGIKPLIICDMGHNEAGIREVVSLIGRTSYHKLHMVFGTVNDKEVSKILGLLPKNATYYFCKADIPRGKDAEELALEATQSGLDGKSYPSVAEALEAAKAVANHEDLIFVGGSTFVVAEVVQ